MTRKICVECGKEFFVDDRLRNWNHVKLCSDGCRRSIAAKQKRGKYVPVQYPITKTCDVCGQQFQIKKAGGRPKIYCSKKCFLVKRDNARREEWERAREKRGCPVCGKLFFPAKYAKASHIYCSSKCYVISQYQKHGYKKKRKTKNQSAVNYLRPFIAKRDGGVCALCGSTENPEIHHLDGNGMKDDANNHPDNLSTLCRECHTAIHHVMVANVGGQWTVKGKIFDILNLSGSIRINH